MGASVLPSTPGTRLLPAHSQQEVRASRESSLHVGGHPLSTMSPSTGCNPDVEVSMDGTRQQLWSDRKSLRPDSV